MFTLGRFFPFAGSHVAASFAGALNAAGSVRERDRWTPRFVRALASPWAGVASRDACDAFDFVRRLARGQKRRQVKRAVVRCSKRERVMLKNLRGAHWRATQSR